MNVDDLIKLPLDELRIIRHKNLILFKILTLSDLAAFYHGLYAEKWLLLFATLGIFIACFSLYDNYKLTDNLLTEKLEA